MITKEISAKVQRRVGLFCARNFMKNWKRKIHTQPFDVTRIGTSYGGWTIPNDFTLDRDDAILCAGAGEDISFDTEMARRFGCRVVTADPTPRAVRHFELLKQAVDKGEAFFTLSGTKKFQYRISKAEIERIIYLPAGLSGGGNAEVLFSTK